MVQKISQLANASNWRGVVALDRAGRVAYGNFGIAYDQLGDFSNAIEYHTHRLAMAEEMGDRDGQGLAYTNLGSADRSLGDVDRAIQYFTQHLSIAKKLGDRLEEGGAGVPQPGHLPP